VIAKLGSHVKLSLLIIPFAAAIVSGCASTETVKEAKGQGLWSWGERIAVFVTPKATNSTEVEVVSKAVLSPLNFPPDWQQILLDQIDVELRSRK